MASQNGAVYNLVDEWRDGRGVGLQQDLGKTVQGAGVWFHFSDVVLHLFLCGSRKGAKG